MGLSIPYAQAPCGSQSATAVCTLAACGSFAKTLTALIQTDEVA